MNKLLLALAVTILLIGCEKDEKLTLDVKKILESNRWEIEKMFYDREEVPEKYYYSRVKDIYSFKDGKMSFVLTYKGEESFVDVGTYTSEHVVWKNKTFRYTDYSNDSFEIESKENEIITAYVFESVN